MIASFPQASQSLAIPGQLEEYALEKVLGQGGFGITYLARDRHLDKAVAIKEFFPVQFATRQGNTITTRDDQDTRTFQMLRQRFVLEARALARFQHPNIVRVLRFFQANGTAYMVMDYELGQSLSQWRKEQSGLSEGALMRIFQPLLDGVEQMHRLHLLHRDIKPDNIFIRESDGSPVLLDFGSALEFSDQGTKSGTAMLTPGYAPMEQYPNSHLEQGPWTDIYGLGSVLYWALRGKRPGDAMARYLAVTTGRPDPLPRATTLGEGRFSAAFLQAIDQGLGILPHDRPREVTSWRAALMGLPLLRIFLDAPPDVHGERFIARQVVERMAREFSYSCRLGLVAPDAAPSPHPSLRRAQQDIAPSAPAERSGEATLITPEDPPLAEGGATEVEVEILAPPPLDDPGRCDLMVMILWSRLSDPYPGQAEATPGTQWAFQRALENRRQSGTPELMLFRKEEVITSELNDKSAMDHLWQQKGQVESFMGRWFAADSPERIQASVTSFAALSQFESLLEEQLRQFLGQRQDAKEIAQRERRVLWRRGSPFRGLEAFAMEHAQVFFGRTHARHELRRTLLRQAEKGCALALVLGASGSGKSSLVMAGLLPDLVQGGAVPGVALCRYALMRPGDHRRDPRVALAQALAGEHALPELESLLYDQKTLTKALCGEQAALPIQQGLDRIKPPGGRALLILVVDQFEELFTLEGVDDPRRIAFIQTLSRLAHSGAVWVVLTMRSDFFHLLERFPSLAELAAPEARFLLSPPNAAEISQIIRQPAREAGLTFERDQDGVGLDDILREAVGQNPFALPLLAFTLEQLWRQRTGDGTLTLDSYRELGGLEGALGRRAETIFQQQAPEVQATLPRLLRALVTVSQDEKARATARLASMDRFSSGAQGSGNSPAVREKSPERRLLDALLAERLLVTSGDDGAATVRVAHEALFSHWARLKTLIEEETEDLQRRGRLEQAARLWKQAEAADQDSLLLPAGKPLFEAEDLLLRRRDDLEGDIIAFIQASLKTHEQARQHKALEERRKRRRRFAIAGVVTVLLGVALVGWSDSQDAWKMLSRMRTALSSQQEAADTLKREMKGKSILLTRTVTALEGNIQALSSAGVLAEQWRRSLDRQWFQEQYFTGVRLSGRFREARQQQHVNQAHLFGLHAFDRFQSLLQARDEAPVPNEDGGDEPEAVGSAVALPGESHTRADGLAQSSREKSQPATDPRIEALIAQSQRLSRLDMGPGATRGFLPPGLDDLFAMAEEQRAALAGHLVSDTTLPLVLSRSTPGGVLGLAYGPSGETLGVIDKQGALSLWDARRLKPSPPLALLPAQVVNLAFAADDARLAVHMAKGEVRILAWKDGQWAFTQARMDLAATRGVALAFDPAGTLLGARLGDDAIRIQTLPASGKMTVTQLPSRKEMTHLALAGNGRWLAVGDAHGAIQVWDWPRQKPALLLKGHYGPIRGLSFSRDGTRLASLSLDHTAKLWSLPDGDTLASLDTGKPLPGAIALSPDGEVMTMGGMGAPLRVHLRAGPKDLLLPHKAREVALSGDGALLASFVPDQGVTLWDAVTGRALGKRNLAAEGGNVRLAFTRDGTALMASDGRTLTRHDIASGRNERFPLDREGLFPPQCGFSGHGGRLAMVRGDRLEVVDSGSGKGLFARKMPTVAACLLSRDGVHLLASDGNGATHLWNLDAGGDPITMPGHDFDVSLLALTPDGNLAALSSGVDGIRLWQPRERAFRPLPLSQAESPLTGMAFSAQGQLLAAGYSDGSIRIWRMAVARWEDRPAHLLAILPPASKAGVERLFFSESGDTLVSAGDNAPVHLQNLGALFALYSPQAIPIRIAAAAENYGWRLADMEMAPVTPGRSMPVWPPSHPYHWLPLARRGQGTALTHMGLIIHGQGNLAQAQQLYQAAMEAGDPAAANHLRRLRQELDQASKRGNGS